MSKQTEDILIRLFILALAVIFIVFCALGLAGLAKEIFLCGCASVL